MELLEIVDPEFYGEVSGFSYPFQPFPSLEHLEFTNMSSWEKWLPSLVSEGDKFPFPCLKSLCLRNCPNLKGQLPQHLPSLAKFEISECFQLQSMPFTLLSITSIKKLLIRRETHGSLLKNGSKWSLEDISIKDCDSLPSLPEMILSNNCLQRLSLASLPSLASFPKDGMPTSLMSLYIFNCNNLAFLPHETWCNYKSLVHLSIGYSCDSLVSFPLDCFPVLKDLCLHGCRKLQFLCISESSMDRPSSLQSLDIYGCDILTSLPKPIQMLTALVELYIYDCPNLASIGEGGLPSNLTSFRIMRCGRQWVEGITDLGLQRLTSLHDLRIENDYVVKCLLKERMLPPSLITLGLSNVSDMKLFEGNGLQLLTSLEQLSIIGCERLERLPEDGLQHLTYLDCLYIWNCGKLESLPKHTLPPSLFLLNISNCPVLEERYKSERGEHWSEIAHIPVIEINFTVII